MTMPMTQAEYMFALSERLTALEVKLAGRDTMLYTLITIILGRRSADEMRDYMAEYDAEIVATMETGL